MTRAATRNVIAMLITDNYSVKPRPNDRNISTEHIATLLGTTCFMLLATVASCCDMLGVVRSNLKMVIFFMQHLWMLHDVVVIWPGSCNNVAPVHGDCALVRCRNMLQHGGQTRTTCCSQQCCDPLRSNVAIAWLELANAGPAMLGYVVLRCCDHLAGA